jgi:hypothetical protein
MLQLLLMRSTVCFFVIFRHISTFNDDKILNRKDTAVEFYHRRFDGLIPQIRASGASIHLLFLGFQFPAYIPPAI